MGVGGIFCHDGSGSKVPIAESKSVTSIFHHRRTCCPPLPPPQPFLTFPLLLLLWATSFLLNIQYSIFLLNCSSTDLVPSIMILTFKDLSGYVMRIWLSPPQCQLDISGEVSHFTVFPLKLDDMTPNCSRTNSTGPCQRNLKRASADL